MRLTLFTDYSLRVLIFVAARPEGRATVAQVAGAYGISEHHLTKVVHHLGKAGWLTNARGRGGGFALTRPAGEVRIGAVVRSTEGSDVLVECFNSEENHCLLTPACAVPKVLDEALAAFYGVLDRYTLEDLAQNRKALQPLLFQRPPMEPAACPPRNA